MLRRRLSNFGVGAAFKAIFMSITHLQIQYMGDKDHNTSERENYSELMGVPKESNQKKKNADEGDRKCCCKTFVCLVHLHDGVNADNRKSNKQVFPESVYSCEINICKSRECHESQWQR